MYLRGKWSFPDLGSYLLCAVTKEVIMNFKSVTVDHCQLVYRHALGKNFKLHYRIHKMALSGWYMVQKYAKLMPFIKNESVKKYFQDFEKILVNIFWELFEKRCKKSNNIPGKCRYEKMNFCSCFREMNLTKSTPVNRIIPRIIFSRVYFYRPKKQKICQPRGSRSEGLYFWIEQETCFRLTLFINKELI